jgi:predicted nucleic acid-binding Zn ribbon protein
MPTYDYLCPNGHRFEVIHSVTAAGPLVHVPVRDG